MPIRDILNDGYLERYFPGSSLQVSGFQIRGSGFTRFLKAIANGSVVRIEASGLRAQGPDSRTHPWGQFLLGLRV